MFDINSFLLEKEFKTVYYIPEFITEEEEKNLQKNINDSPKPKWTQLKNRRLQNWGGIPSSKGMVLENIPDWLSIYCKKIYDLNIFQDNIPNHVLINEYKPGQGIMPHEDGPMYYPTVSTISLGSHTLLDFYKPIDSSNESNIEERYMFSLFLEPRSLLILKDEMYKVYLHGIKEVEEDKIIPDKILNFDKINNGLLNSNNSIKRDTRISLTIRHVPKVLKINVNSLLFGNKK